MTLNIVKLKNIQIIFARQRNTICFIKRITFIPVCFFRQFLNFGNIYFLACAVILCLKEISPVVNYFFPVPLAFIIFVSVIREAFEEFVV